MSSLARVPAEGPNPVATDAFAPFSLEGPIGPLSQPLGGGGGVEHERLDRFAAASSLLSRRMGPQSSATRSAVMCRCG